MVIPRLLTRSWTSWLSLVVGLGGGLVVIGWFAVTDEDNRLAALVILPVYVAGLLLAVVRRTWVDPDAGEVVLEVSRVWRRRWRWAQAEVMGFVPHGAGGVVLRIHGPDHRAALHIDLLAGDFRDEQALAPQHLRVLAGEIERWAAVHGQVAAALRAQADHLAAGGSVFDSPLAERSRGARPG